MNKSAYIKYHVAGLKPVEKHGDCWDLRSAETVELKAGEVKYIDLGVTIKPPTGYRINVYCRSSTEKQFGIMLTHSVGIIDHNYCGENDRIKFRALALRDTVINFNDRIAQFEFVPIYPDFELIEVDEMTDPDRGGFGSTGK